MKKNKGLSDRELRIVIAAIRWALAVRAGSKLEEFNCTVEEYCAKAANKSTKPKKAGKKWK